MSLSTSSMAMVADTAQNFIHVSGEAFESLVDRVHQKCSNTVCVGCLLQFLWRVRALGSHQPGVTRQLLQWNVFPDLIPRGSAEGGRSFLVFLTQAGLSFRSAVANAVEIVNGFSDFLP